MFRVHDQQRQSVFHSTSSYHLLLIAARLFRHSDKISWEYSGNTAALHRYVQTFLRIQGSRGKNRQGYQEEVLRAGERERQAKG